MDYTKIKLTKLQKQALIKLFSNELPFGTKEISQITLQSLLRNGWAKIDTFGPGNNWYLSKKGSDVAKFLINDPFIKFMESEFDWNQANFKEYSKSRGDIETVIDDTEMRPDEWSRAFILTCLAGSNIKTELSTAIKKFQQKHPGLVTEKFKIFADPTNIDQRSFSHIYTIVFL
jgi:hypothetical protein